MDETVGHRAEFETPTEMRYQSGAPPPPGPFDILVSEVEVRVAIALTDLHAA